MKPTKFVILIILIISISIGAVYIYSLKNTEVSINKTPELEENDKISLSKNLEQPIQCAQEGESIGTCVNCMPKCCENLNPMPNLKYDGVCTNLPAPGSGATCSACGNNICDTQNNEDECNCPEDCN